MTEKIECTNCGNEVDESKVIECNDCNNQYCKDCSTHCEECDNDYCNECYSDDSIHECDVGFQIVIGFKNCSDKSTYTFTHKQKAIDFYSQLVNSWKGNTEKFIEHNDTTILISEIKLIDLRL